MKCIASVPPKYKDYIEYQPDMGFVQPGASFEMGIKFRPQHELVKAASPFCLEDSDVVAIPLKLKCPDQKLPVWYTLKARLTSGDINFSAKTFEFGNCYVGEGLSMPLTLTNTSLLPQKFGFVQLKDEVDVQPEEERIGILLPKESKLVQVIFKPRIAQVLELPLVCKTTMNMTYNFVLKGVGIDPPFGSNKR